MNNQFATQFLREDQDEVNKSIEDVLKQTGADEELVDMFMNAIRNGLLTPEKAIEIIRDTFKGVNEDGMGGGSTTGGGVTNGASFTPGNGEQYAMGTKKVRKTLGETTVGQHFDLDVKSERGDGSIQRYQLKNVKLVNSNERVFEKPDGTTVVLSPSDKYTATKVGNLDENTSETTLKVGDKVKYENQEWEIVNFLTNGNVRLKSLKGLPSTNVMPDKIKKIKTEDAPRLAGEPSKTDRGGARNLSAYTKDGFTKAPSAEEAAKTIKGVEVKDLWGKKALEENYFKFRNETKTRGKSEQFHEAVKIINKKLDEVNKLLEFTGTLKTELSESEDTFEVKTYTKKSMNKVRGKVIEAYQKLKQL